MSKLLIQKILPSLEQFELGDGGGPATLIAFDAENLKSSSKETRTLIDLWFAEEKEHSRLLGCAVRRLGGRKLRGHWSFSAFCLCRKVLGVRFELQVLLLTEIVSTAYYRVLRRHVPDIPIKQMCNLILRDEAGHVAFHLDRLAATRGGSLAWRLQFWLCALAAATMLWVNHRVCLEAIGGAVREYYGEVKWEIGRFLRRLDRKKSKEKTLGRSRRSIRLPQPALTAKPLHG